MDSTTEALKYVFISIPLCLISKVVEAMGFVYGFLKHPFQDGVYRSNKAYEKLKNGKS